MGFSTEGWEDGADYTKEDVSESPYKVYEYEDDNGETVLRTFTKRLTFIGNQEKKIPVEVRCDKNSFFQATIYYVDEGLISRLNKNVGKS